MPAAGCPFVFAPFLSLWPSLSPSWASNGREKIITFTAFLSFSLPPIDIAAFYEQGQCRWSAVDRIENRYTRAHPIFLPPSLPAIFHRRRKRRAWAPFWQPSSLSTSFAAIEGRRKAFFNAATLGTMSIPCPRKFTLSKHLWFS